MNKTLTYIILLFAIAINVFAQQNVNSNANDGTKIDIQRSRMKSEQPSDTFDIKNKIVSVYNDGEQFYVKLSMSEESEIKLEVYNMLAKPVKTIYSGKAPVEKELTYDFNASMLPNGIYFVILQGNGFRHPYKFTIRR
jgi:hypothetical protein